jgi:hypothetical protein
MQQGQGELVEAILENEMRSGRVICRPGLIPAPGQYLLAHDGSDAILPALVFSAGRVPGGFLAAPPLPGNWGPGARLFLRGPFGHGFLLPVTARRVVLAALGNTAARLLALLAPALAQGAAVVLVTEAPPPGLPPEVEIQPPAALPEVCAWTDYLAIDALRESLPGLRRMLGLAGQAAVSFVAQALVVTPMPCGGVAECGVCAVSVRHGWKMACKDGPVFDLNKLLE